MTALRCPLCRHVQVVSDGDRAGHVCPRCRRWGTVSRMELANRPMRRVVRVRRNGGDP